MICSGHLLVSRYHSDKPINTRSQCPEVSHLILYHNRSNLLSSYGDTTVTLSSANSYSYDKVKISFSDYCEQHTGPQNIETLGNGET